MPIVSGIVSELKPTQETVVDSISNLNETTVASNRSMLNSMEQRLQDRNSNAKSIISHLKIMIDGIQSLKEEIIGLERSLKSNATDLPNSKAANLNFPKANSSEFSKANKSKISTNDIFRSTPEA